MGIGWDVALQLKASELNFSVVLFITLYEVVITFFYNIFLVEFEMYEVTVTLRIKWRLNVSPGAPQLCSYLAVP